MNSYPTRVMGISIRITNLRTYIYINAFSRTAPGKANVSDSVRMISDLTTSVPSKDGLGLAPKIRVFFLLFKEHLSFVDSLDSHATIFNRFIIHIISCFKCRIFY